MKNNWQRGAAPGKRTRTTLFRGVNVCFVSFFKQKKTSRFACLMGRAIWKGSFESTRIFWAARKKKRQDGGPFFALPRPWVCCQNASPPPLLWNLSMSKIPRYLEGIASHTQLVCPVDDQKGHFLPPSEVLRGDLIYTILRGMPFLH